MQDNSMKGNSRRIKQRRKRGIRLLALAIFLICGIRLLGWMSEGSSGNLGNLTWQESGVPAGYIDEEDANLVKPQKRSENEVRSYIKKLAKKDKAYKEIYENYDAYPEQLLEALCSNPEMIDFVKDYPDAAQEVQGGFTRAERKEKLPLLIQWDERWGYAPYGNSNVGLSGCAPTCLSMVVLALTGDTLATPDQIAAFAAEHGYYEENTGTSWSFFTQGCEHFGVHGQEISLDEGVIRKHLQQGEPVVCSMRPGDFTSGGHFIVLAGESEDGRIIVHDPNSRKRSKVLWDYETLEPQIKNLWSFSK
ncbi:MAG: C39 family peptidase [Agathobacter sp.]